MMSVLQDIVVTNKKVMTKSFKAIQKNPALLGVGVLYVLLLLVGFQVSIIAGFLGGIVMTLVQSALLSSYLFLMNRIIRTGRFKQEDMTDGVRVYFRKIWITLIIVFVAQYGLSLVAQIFGTVLPFAGLIWIIAYCLAIILLNPLPEVIYQKHVDELGTFTYAYGFVKENWIDWFIPNVLLGAVIWVVNTGINMAFGAIASGFSIGLGLSFPVVISAIVLQAFISYSMIYRGLLFHELSTTTRRKRLFMRHMNQ